MVNFLSVDRKMTPGIVGESDKQKSEKLNRIARLKAQNSALFTAQTEPSHPTDGQSYAEIAEACFEFLRTRSLEDETELARVLEKNNLELHCYKSNPVSRDKSLVARMAFNGRIDRPDEFQLSPLLRNMKNNPSARQNPLSQNAYDLAYCSAWNVFKEVPEFAALEDVIKKGLSTYGIPPERLAEINAKDICFLINEQMRSGRRDGAKVLPISYKARHTMRFINENEQEFRKGLLSMPGVRQDYVDALVGAMKRGLTDLTKVRDDYGQRIWKEEWKDQPVVDVHHIVNVKDCSALEEGGLKNFMDVDKYENMCFIVRHPQHNAMHALEHDLIDDRPRNDIFYNRELNEKYIYRIQPPEGVKCMFGFHNFMYDKEYLKQHGNERIDKDKGKNYYKNQPNRHNRHLKETLKFKGGHLTKQEYKGNHYEY